MQCYKTRYYYFFTLSLGQGKNGDQEAEPSARNWGNPIHGPLCQKCHWRIQACQTLQKYPSLIIMYSRLSPDLWQLCCLLFLRCLFCVIISWLSCTPQWAARNVWAQPGEDGSYICRHKCLHAAHDVSGHGGVPVHAGLGWRYELRREDRSTVQVNRSVGNSSHKD